MSIDQLKAAAVIRKLTPTELSQLRGRDPYGRLSSSVKVAQANFARAIAISSANKGGASATPLTLKIGNGTNGTVTSAGLGDFLGGIIDSIGGGGGIGSIIGGIGDIISGGDPPSNFVPVAGPCTIPGQRVDPVTGDCRFYLGTASGPESGGQAVVGGFGLPALAPAIVGEINGKPVRRCNKGSVLGTDNLCYSKAVLPPRSKFRKWKRPPRPIFSRSDEKAIRRAASVKDKVGDLARDAGLYVANSKPKARARAAQHSHTVTSHNGKMN